MQKQYGQYNVIYVKEKSTASLREFAIFAKACKQSGSSSDSQVELGGERRTLAKFTCIFGGNNNNKFLYYLGYYHFLKK